jgi:alcohol dehydrogenase (cytochrome c)
MDGSLVAYDDTSLDQVWKFNVGTGFNAPPMTFEASAKQYIAILSHCRARRLCGLGLSATGRIAGARSSSERRSAACDVADAQQRPACPDA